MTTIGRTVKMMTTGRTAATMTMMTIGQTATMTITGEVGEAGGKGYSDRRIDEAWILGRKEPAPMSGLLNYL